LCKEIDLDRIYGLEGKVSLLAGMPIVAKETDRNDRIEGMAVRPEEVRISQKALDRLFGYDYFIAHGPVDGKDYASALYEALMAKGNKLDCFLDVNIIAPVAV
jgi:hypothetical protein